MENKKMAMRKGGANWFVCNDKLCVCRNGCFLEQSSVKHLVVCGAFITR